MSLLSSINSTCIEDYELIHKQHESLSETLTPKCFPTLYIGNNVMSATIALGYAQEPRYRAF